MMRTVFLCALLVATAAEENPQGCPLNVPIVGCVGSKPLAMDGVLTCTYTRVIKVIVYCRPVIRSDDTDFSKILDPLSCSFEKISKCALPTTVCVDGQRPAFTNCCPSCKVTLIKPTCAVPPDCAKGVEPSKVDGCLSCKVPLSLCSVDQVTACKARELPTCAEDEKPQRTPDCCYTCAPAVSACGLSTDLLARATRCATSYDKLTVCADGVLPKFNTDTCCPTCKIAAIKPPAGPICTKEEFLTCTKAVPECAAGQEASKTSGCCKSCRRSERNCDFLDAVQACADLPACSEGERPSPVESSCCPSCRPTIARPTCPSACADGEVCARTKTGPACRPAVVRKLVLNANATAAIKDRIATIAKDPAQAKEALLEMVNRFCDKVENANICTLASKLRDRMQVNTTAAGDQVTVTFANDDDDAPSRRLLQLPAGTASGPDDLFDAATRDPESRGNVTVTDTARACPLRPSSEVCSRNQTATFTQKCQVLTSVFYCKPNSEIPKDTTTPPMTCTYDKLKACNVSALPVCEANTRPDFAYATCCPKCKFDKPTTEQPECGIPADCAADVKPARDDKGCLTCKVPVEKCTAEQWSKCKATPPATCTVGEKPTRTADCCLSCMPAPSACGDDKEVEGRTAHSCATDFKALPECAAGKRPEFNPDTCCPSCRPVRTPPAEGTTDKCTKKEFLDCLNSTAVCADGEEPVRTTGCCRSCRRPERRCSVADVVKKCEQVPNCADGEKPVHVDGSCCPSCKPVRKCARVCDAGSKCRLVKGDETCKKVEAKKWKFAFGQALPNATSMTEAEITAAVKEIVARFCDREDSNAPALCVDKDAAIANIVARITKSATDKSAEIEIDTDAPTGRRLLQSSNLLNAALSDVEASGGFVIGSATTLPPAQPPAPQVNSAKTLAAGVAVFLPFVLL